VDADSSSCPALREINTLHEGLNSIKMVAFQKNGFNNSVYAARRSKVAERIISIEIHKSEVDSNEF